MSTDQTIEQEIQAKGLTAPRVTPADIEAAIAAEFTYCVGHALNEAGTYFGVYEVKDGTDNANEHARRHLGLLTICVLVMRNGFTVVGKSACASPENFDAEVGRNIARQDAINQCSPLLGYELRSKLAARPADYRDRVRQERAELDEKRMALAAFFGTDRFAGLPGAERQRMRDQLEAMRQYSAVLQERIEAFDCPAEAQWKEANA